MQRNRTDSSSSSPEKFFSGVRFVLFGFDPVSESQYLEELVSRGGTDVGRYDPSCTHVIVCDRVYDDPICVAARHDRKTVVAANWIDDSVAAGAMADASRVLYRPPKDLNGIPGCELLVVCLTGYQKQERNDVMKMVDLMGAHFSKPLIANKVTHLVCYKFEGEKYELAKKVNIKLVNHRWLEDCLKAWELLPTDNYTKSSWELEILDAEAMDSEEESEDPGTRNQNRGISSLEGRMLVSAGADAYISSVEKPKDAAKQADCSVKNHILSTPRKETTHGKALDMQTYEKKPQGFDDAGAVAQASDAGINTDAVNGEAKPFPDKLQGSSSLSNLRAAKRGSPVSSAADEKATDRSYPRKTLRLVSAGPSNNFPTTPKGNLKASESTPQEAITDHAHTDIRSPIPGIGMHSSSVFTKKINNLVPDGMTSPKSDTRKSLESPPKSGISAQLPTSKTLPRSGSDHGLAALNSGLDGTFSNSKVSQQAASSKFRPPSCKNKSLKNTHAAETKSSKSPISSAHKKTDLLFDDIQKQELDKQLITRNKLDAMGTRMENAVSSNDKMIPELPLDNEHTMDAHASMKNKAMFLETMAIDAPSTSKISPMKAPVPLLSGSAEPGVVTKLDTGVDNAVCHVPKLTGDDITMSDIAMSDIANATTEEPGEASRSQEEGILPRDSLNTDTRKLPSIATVEKCKGSEAKRSFISRTKVVTRMNFNRNDDVKNPGEIGTVEKLDKVISDKKHTAMEQTPDDVVMEDKVKATKDSRKDKKVICSDKSVNLNKTALKSRKVAKMKASQKLEKKINKEKTVSGEPDSKESVKENKVKEVSKSRSENNRKNIAIDGKKSSMDLEKGKVSKVNGASAVKTNSHSKTNMIDKHRKRSMQDSISTSPDRKSNMQTSSCSRVAIPEPALFLLSGHRFQRREFQMVIKHLKGRVCRDSHHWSYQATHFIVPGPVRRTEKFFAAAAAGRWILKMDYLTASNAAGKFLDEEPFEWYSKGLTEDGSISLEAPRKWRLLRERTGHGALYGMKIVIYGDCIAPTLDTLKRVVKAGDGTILATSPPYTRFLDSGVDYAIISSSMPRVDIWVQEFLQHKIPCVLADYLVEYVCKPGYSLDKHVLYKTNTWADKSFTNLLNRSEEVVLDEEIVPDATCSGEDDVDDISCSVCGSRDRGDVMLICGDADGVMGCGIGAHIDCCDPPLEAVPEEDWFCPKCSKSRRALKTTPKSRKTKSSSKK